MVEPHELSGLQLAAAVRRREISPVELVEHQLARIERLSERLGAFVTVTAQSAREQARAAERLVLDTADPAQLPPLLGVPTAIKDLNAVAGVPMKLGSAAFADLVPGYDDQVVTALRAAGTISLGKTNTPELGLPCYTEPEPQVAPPARSPWAPSRSAGGSSGGAGAAVAAGMVPWAQGSDGGGSIRIPASACGLVGLKTTRGRVSNGPMGTDGAGLAVNGPLTRTVADAAALLDAMAGPGPGDALWAPALPGGSTFLAAASAPPGRLRIGRFVANVVDAPVDPECLLAWENTSTLLAGLGHEVVDVPVPDFGGLFEHFIVAWSVGAASAPVPPEREHLLRPLTRWLRDLGRSTDAVAYATALATLQRASRAHLASTADVDVLLTPTLAQLPAPVGSLRDDSDPAADFAAQARFTPYTALWNTTGQPAISLPLHHTGPLPDAPAGLPVGVQLVGRPAAEATLLSLAGQLELAAPWAHRIAPTD